MITNILSLTSASGTSNRLRESAITAALFVALLSTPTLAQANDRADINRDGWINFLDVVQLSSCFLEDTRVNSTCANEDINQNGVVNFEDLTIVRDHFLQEVYIGDDFDSLSYPSIPRDIVNFPNNTDGMRVHDLNGDGLDDVVITSTGLLELHFNDPDGLFAEPVLLSNSCDEGAIRILDFNQDGLEDILVGGSGRCNFNQRDDGTFNDGTVYGSGTLSAVRINFADVNNDGIIDLVGRFTGDIWVYRGDGTGLYPAPVQIFSPDDLTVRALTVLDVNGDGFDDAIASYSAIGDGPDQLHVYLGRTSGTLNQTPYQTIDLPNNFSSLRQCDLEGDGQNEILTLDTDSDDITVLAPTEGQLATVSVIDTQALGLTQSFVCADWTGDGREELIFETAESSDDYRIFSYHNGMFVEVDQLKIADRTLANFQVGHINGDGTPDLVFSETDQVFVQMSSGTAGYNIATVYENAQNFAHEVITAQLTDDDFPDVVAAYFDGTIGVRANTTGELPDSQKIQTLVGEAIYLRAADLNGDDLDDILAFNQIDSSIIIALSDGDGSFADITTLPTGPLETTFAVTDLNDDGRVDVYTGQAAYFGNGDGTFTSEPNALFSFGRATVLSDFNGDQLPDVAAIDSSGLLLISFGDGTSMFPQPDPVNQINLPIGPFSLGNRDAQIFSNDIDSDGFPDIVIRFLDTVQIYKNEEGNSFALSDSFVIFLDGNNVSEYYLQLADINSDGAIDLLYSGLRARLGGQDIAYSDRRPLKWIEPDRFYKGFVAHDFDLDGDVDLLVPSRTDTVIYNHR